MTTRSSALQNTGVLGAALGVGFVYWVAFDLALEPGNISRAIRAGISLSWSREALRIAGAGALGASAAPVLFWLARRFPMDGPLNWRYAAFHITAGPVLSVILIGLSCPLAALLLTSERRPPLMVLRDQLAANAPVVTFSMLGFVAVAHVVQRAIAKVRPPRQWLREVAVKNRSGAVLLEVSRVDWIETQGNYLALHVGSQVHLVRASAKTFEAALDPARFVRIHRRTIIAVERIRSLHPLNSGDAIVRLDTGVELRVSRAHREQLHSRLQVRLGTARPTS